MKVAFIQKSSYEKVSVHYLAGALRDAGIEYELFIEDLEKDFYGELIRYNPSFIVYSLLVGEESVAFEHFKKIKELMPGAKTLMGGVFTLLFPEVFKRKEIDFVFRGDGEFTVPRFIRAIESGKSVKDVEGICFMDEDGNEYRNDNLRLVDVNDSSKPDRDLYYKYDRLRNKSTKIFIAARGCPYQCTFCYNTEFSLFFKEKYWRQRSIQDVIEEICYVKEKYGLEWVHFQDGTFNADKKWLKSFLEEYDKAGLPQFLCNARVETIDEEIVSLLKKTGCNRITFGIQSGNQRIRQGVAGRHTTDKKILEACELCKKYKIRVGIDVIFGWPSETLEEAMDTVRLCRKVDVDTYSSNVLIFYPGLRVTKYAYENNYIERIPTLDEIRLLNSNRSLLNNEKKKLFINMDKLFYYIVKFPKFEKIFLNLIKLPPNRLFLFLKNTQFMARSLKYDKDTPKSKTIFNYMAASWRVKN